MGYDPDFLESLGRCRECGGSKDYPMLVTEPLLGRICRSGYHSLRFRIAAFFFKKITGKEPKQ